MCQEPVRSCQLGRVMLETYLKVLIFNSRIKIQLVFIKNICCMKVQGKHTYKCTVVFWHVGVMTWEMLLRLWFVLQNMGMRDAHLRIVMRIPW
jgi:hypothetical protein